ncbi:hypothetical protein EYC80_003474 [Monilinia laxa]|uniref:Uncharacterized protein n=1 Tax=Monilinia laxa TaxID=61186 RepID=A0A5N6KDX0_MONLA|nr:hypothetical protein EYC80_003474 [Monilinia laxa]
MYNGQLRFDDGFYFIHLSSPSHMILVFMHGFCFCLSLFYLTSSYHSFKAQVSSLNSQFSILNSCKSIPFHSLSSTTFHPFHS